MSEKLFVAGAIFGFLVFLTVGGTSQAAGRAGAPGIGDRGNLPARHYIIGPGDSLQVFVWKNPELSTTVPVRPDGRISIPLVEDIECAGKTPPNWRAMSRNVSRNMSWIRPLRSSCHGFIGPYTEQIRIVGEAAQPKLFPTARTCRFSTP